MDLHELGAFLKSRRDRIRPSDVGLPGGPRRRVPGLRRDEVAHLAGASVEYYTELEQGSGAQPSEQMLAAFARALRLDLDERNHLYHLAGRPVPPAGSAASHVHPGMLDLMSRMPHTPAMVVTDLHVTLVQNSLAHALIGNESAYAGRRASLVYRWFTEPAERRIYPEADHDYHAHAFTADLRAAVARRGSQDEEARHMVDDLIAASAEFAELWAAHDVAVRRNDRKRIVHSTLGTIEVNCLSLFSEDGRQRLLWFTPAVGTPAVEQFELLSVIGTQDLTPEYGRG
ncbi:MULTISPECIES: helix-turn-helix transcriptional regulator [unclassified Streptomyces]|uniref:helix-turn-helix transcriptional regulator n=1 Tax=unclassified Streptomyces TaxID=2593676 RepID=UPI0033C298CC